MTKNKDYVVCNTCGKQYSLKGIGTHKWRSHGEGQHHNPNSGFLDGSRSIWNKGHTEVTHEKVKQAADLHRKNLKDGVIKPSFSGRKHTALTKSKMADKAGYRPGSGRGKQGWCNGIWCDSTWEAAWVLWAQDEKLDFIKNKKTFSYQWQGKSKKYLPDFELHDCYLEIKGWILPQDYAKWESRLDKPLIILTKKEMQPILDWAYQKHGKDLTEVYTKQSRSSVG